MENNKQQTAVEWFHSKIKQLEFWVETRQITWKEYHKEKDKLLEQAKEMEKRQIVDAWGNGFDEDDRATSNPFKYYNETYGGGEQ